MIRLNLLLCFMLVMVLVSCREEFDPPTKSSAENFLVVEGVLNVGGPTTIRITRSFRLEDSARLRGERNANVSVEGKDNTIQLLSMTGDGIYTSPNLNLVINNEYRLRIQTNNGKEYLSDYVIARQTPPIDSIGWEKNNDGVQIYVNTSDPSNNTRYYKWDFDETWEINSYYQSLYKYQNGVVSPRSAAEDVYICWKNAVNSSIKIGTSTRLQSDVISKAPLVFTPNGNDKFSVRYSIMVRQYALDKKAYEFYELMKTNTESLGTIFDPQPTEITGNIRCVTDATEPVIGFITASTISEKRIFISRSQLGGWDFYQYCESVLVANHPDSIELYFENGGFEPYGSDELPIGIITGYFSSFPPCVDCVKRGGSTVRPAFW